MSADQIEAAVSLIARVYAFQSAGGNCHVVLDDENLDTDSIRFTLDEWLPAQRIANPGDHAQHDVEVACMEHLLTLSMTQRRKARRRYFEAARERATGRF